MKGFHFFPIRPPCRGTVFCVCKHEDGGIARCKAVKKKPLQERLFRLERTQDNQSISSMMRRSCGSMT
jgi:hypothetical protein